VRGMASRHTIPSKCLHPNAGNIECRGKIVNSHTVSKSSTLRRVALGGHVYHFKPDVNALFDNGGELSCILVGVSRASTFLGFCRRHDKEMFSPVEDETFQSNEIHTFLLGYRALTKEIYAKESVREFIPQMRELDRGRTVSEHEFLQNTLNAFLRGTELGLRDLYHHKTSYDKAFNANDYSSSKYLVLRFSAVPNIVFSGALYPEYDLSGNALQTLGQGAGILDSVAVNAIATPEGGAVIFHWLGDNNTDIKLAKSIIAIPNEQKGSAITQFAFEAFENLFISPEWWDGLDPRLRDILAKRVLCGGSVRNHGPECFVPDGNEYFNWGDCTVEHNLDTSG